MAPKKTTIVTVKKTPNVKLTCPIPGCLRPANQICTRCRLISYCSAPHQRAHWKDHKEVCGAFMVKKEPDSRSPFTKYCIAHHDLNPGDILLEESPLFHMPEAVDEGDGLDVPHCVTCGLNLVDNGNPTNRCSSCGWPICGPECQKADIHSTNECKYLPYHLLQTHDDFKPLPSFLLPNFILTIRAIIRFNFQDGLMATVKTIPIPGGVSEANCFKLQNGVSMHDFLDKVYDLLFHPPTGGTMKPILGGVEKDDVVFMIIYMANLLKKQGFITGGSHATVKVLRQRGSYLYQKAWSIRHSCSPNCTWMIGPFPHFKIRIRAAVHIKKGEMLTLSRIMFYEKGFYGTFERQRIFRSLFGFPCQCRLCMDPTEFKTYMSAIICPACPNTTDYSAPSELRELGSSRLLAGATVLPELERKYELLLSQHPCIFPTNMMWKCSRAECGRIVSVTSYFEIIRSILTKVDEYYDDQSAATNGETIVFCHQVLAEHRNKTFPQSHWIFLHIHKLLFFCAAEEIRKKALPLQDIKILIDRINASLSVLDTIIPGLFHERATTISAGIATLQYAACLAIPDVGLLNVRSMRYLIIIIHDMAARQREVHEFYKCCWPPWNRKLSTEHDLVEVMASAVKVSENHLKELVVRLVTFCLQDVMNKKKARGRLALPLPEPAEPQPEPQPET